MSAQIRALGVQHGDRAGLERGIDGKNAHELSLPPSWPGLSARRPRLHNNAKTSMPGVWAGHRRKLLRYWAYIGRTSTTSGTKCLSRFWMPCLRVAVDDGQPEHAPFMLRWTMPSL